MTQASAKDMIIVLPGILGSVLTKHGKDLWNVSLNMASRAFQGEAFVRDLTLSGDDPERATLDDGVVAAGLIPDAQVLAGFWKVDGYTGLINNLAKSLGGKIGDPYTPAPDANIFPFAYDWRRDNRSSARRLQRFVEQQLPVWRRTSGQASAKVILIGHSMGGLVSRYYLEVLGGHEHCRALFTFGTPHRGAVNALGSVVYGQKIAWIDVGAALRSFTSAYQLLPIYEVVERDGAFLKAADLGDLGGLSQARAQQAIDQFHAPIEAAARSRSGDEAGYVYTAIVGTQQLTRQSARLVGGQLSISEHLPGPLLQRSYPDFGDNTVPLFSAMPPGARADRLQRVYVADGHAALQNNPAMQHHLIQSIRLLQSEAALLDAGHFNVGAQAGLRLIVEDAYPHTGGPVRVQPADLPDEPGDLLVTVTSLTTRRSSKRTVPFKDGEWSMRLRQPAPGLYRIRAELASAPAHVQPVTELYEVLPKPEV